MNQGELKVLFKAVQDTSVRKVIDNVKGEVRGLGTVADGVFKKLTGTPFSGTSEAFKKLNPNLKELLAPKGTIKGLRDIRGADLAKIQALPDINQLNKPPVLPEPKKSLVDEIFSGLARKIAPTVIAFKLANMAINGFTDAIKSAIKTIQDAIGFAAKLYAKSLTGGINLSFTAKRQTAADVLGVDEKDVMRFAQAGYVMARLSDATAQFARSAPALAFTSAQFKILQYDILAAATKLADSLSPALNGFAIVLDKLIKIISESGGALKVVASGISTALFGTVATEILKKSGNLFSAIGKAEMESTGGKFGQPQSFMKQLPAGAFEKMGLIIGGGMANMALEYQRRTATAVEKLAQSAAGSGKKQPHFYMGRNAYVNGY